MQSKNVFAGLYKHSLEWLACVSGEHLKHHLAVRVSRHFSVCITAVSGPSGSTLRLEAVRGFGCWVPSLGNNQSILCHSGLYCILFILQLYLGVALYQLGLFLAFYSFATLPRVCIFVRLVYQFLLVLLLVIIVFHLNSCFSATDP